MVVLQRSSEDRNRRITARIGGLALTGTITVSPYVRSQLTQKVITQDHSVVRALTGREPVSARVCMTKSHRSSSSIREAVEVAAVIVLVDVAIWEAVVDAPTSADAEDVVTSQPVRSRS